MLLPSFDTVSMVSELVSPVSDTSVATTSLKGWMAMLPMVTFAPSNFDSSVWAMSRTAC